MKRSITILGIILSLSQMTFAKDYWTIDKNDKGITWQIEKGKAHDDHIEMSGKRVSVVLRYGVDTQQHFHINKSMVWPMLRTIPNNTNASLSRNYNWDLLNGITVNSQFIQPVVTSMQLVDGMLKVNMLNGPIILEATYFPSVDKPALVECYKLVNHSTKPIIVEIPSVNSRSITPKEKGVDGSYIILFRSNKATTQILQPNDTLLFSASIAAYKQDEDHATPIVSSDEWNKRVGIVDEWQRNLVLETPSAVINRMFEFSLNSATLLIVSGHCGQNRPECDFSCSNWLFAIS